MMIGYVFPSFYVYYLEFACEEKLSFSPMYLFSCLDQCGLTDVYLVCEL